MKNIYIILSLILLSKFSFAQLSDVTYTVKTVSVTSHENAPTGSCWELGGEEYTAFLASWDNVNGTQVSTGCQTCDNNGDCTYAGNITLQTRSNNAYSLGFSINAWEDDIGSRCAFETSTLDDDDCHRNESQSYNFREGSFPSNGAYTASPTYGSTGDHTYSFQYTWKYSGTTNLITPTCTPQSTAYSASAIRSWSVNLTAGTTYNFKTCGSSPNNDTYLRLYGTDGFSIVASDDDGCGTVASFSTFTYTAPSTGTYYLENSNYVRNALSSAGTLFYQIIDNQAPSISCPSNISVNTTAGTCAATVSYTTPVGTDNCSATTTRTGGLASGSSFPKGTTTNTFQVTDGGGLTATCSFTVTVSDGQAPSITCPANQSVSATAGTCAATVTYTAPTGTDNCTTATTVQTGGSASGASYPVGVTTNTFKVTDGVGLTSTCSFTVTVNDIQAPTITCPANQSVSAAASTCAATVTYTAPTGTDNCSGSTTTRTAGLASGSSFPVGVTTNTFKVTDAAGLTATCSFTVTVNDTEAPTITCPANQNVSATAGTCAATVTYTAPTGTDNCSGSTTIRTAGLASGSSFPVGVTTNTFKVTDAGGLTATCSFTVTVNDTQAPTITCPANQTASATAGTCAATVTYTAPTGTDNCSGSATIRTTGLASGSSFPVGVTTNTFKVTDAAGLTATCSFTVTVNDTQAPTITCPANQTVSAAAGTCAATVSYTTPTGTDNCSGATTVQVSGLAPGSFPIGTTTNIFKVTDAAGLTATCFFTVTVNDTQAPSITCPANQSVSATTGACSATVSYTAPVGTDNCSGAITSQTGGLSSGASYPVGVTTNTFSVTDASGNSTTCSFTVTVVDNEAPQISCPANKQSGNDASQCSAVVTYSSPVSSDNCSGFTVTQTSGLSSGSAFPVGQTTNVFKVTAANGQTSTCSFKVTVFDFESPSITCNADMDLDNDADICGAVVNYTTPVGTDNCSGAVTVQTEGLASGSTFPIGSTTNTFTVTDASGNSASCSFTVTVNDTEVPTITCPSNITQSNDAGTCGAVVSYTAPTGTDNCPGATTAQTAGQASGSTFPDGTTTNTFTVTDASGNSASCSFTVTVNDTEVPTITCPGNITQGNDAGTCGAVVTYTAPTGTDNCPGATTAQTAGQASGSAFPDGTTTNTFTVTDASGNSASCSFTVTVNDTEVPTISCPSNITQSNDAGTCGAVVNYTAPTGTDNCPGATTAQTAGQASGSTFPDGTTTNTFTVTDASGNSASCSFTVTVNDTEVPTISCPSNITQSNDAGTCGAVVSYTAPTGTDNCPGATTAQTAGQASGSTFPDGTTTNTFTVTDASDNSASCSFTVIVNDTEVPTITCPGNITQGNDAGTCGAVVTYTAPTGTDNCPGATTAQTAGQASGSAFPDGTTTNTFTVTDASGNSASCSFTVTVNDTEVPTISCPSNITQSNDAGTCGAVVNYTAPTGTDNCPGATTAQTAGQASGSTFPGGTTTNTFTVTDASGNSASCSFTVTVNDTEVPTITCPGNITQGNDAGTCGAVVSYTAPTGTDNCPGATTAQTAGQASGLTFPDGTTTNTFTVTDASGNSASCSFTVTINDTEVPTITCPGNITQGNDAGTCGAVVTYPAPTGTDNCPGATTAQTAGQASGSTFPDGTTTNTFTVTDASGNSASCSFTVTVNDTEVPTITCPGNITQGNDAGTCGAVVTYTAPTGTDNCPGATTAQTAGEASGLTFPDGTTTNTFTVTDASGNSASCSFTVTVNDTEVPTISCPSNITQSNDAGTCGAVVSYTAPTGTDNCPGATTAQTAGQASGSTFPGGTTTNTFTVTDASGNSASCSFTVTVNDTEVPTITCPSNITQSSDAGTCGAVVSYTAPTGTDNCPGATTAQTAGQASGSTFPDGTTTNTFTVTDASGNSASCSFTVTVNDTEVPTITCPGNITQGNDAGTCGAVVTYTAPTGTDNCPGATTAQTAGQASGSAFPDGTTTNTFTVTDASGNSASCSFTVTVNDTEVPTISCPSNITQSNDAGTCGAVVNYTAPTGTDNCPGATTAQTAGQASGSTFPDGTTTNTFTVTDASGNSASCSFTVTVNDTEVPTISCPSNITQSNDAGTCGAVVSYTAPTGTDNCPGATTAQTAGQASGSTFPDGTTTNTFTVTDASDNSASCSFTVIVNDTEVPTITCPGNITQGNDAGTCGAVVTYTAPTGTDNCPGATTAQTAGQASGSAFPDGTTTNTFTVTDASGNSASCSFTVTVNDTEVPTISCPSNITQSNDAGTCGAVVNYTAPTGTDNCPGATTAQTAGQASGSTFPGGTTTNTFTVTDASGNSASCSFTVTVNDTEVPTITCPGNITQGNDAGTCGAVVSYTAPTGTDNCPGATTAQTAGQASGLTFPDGTTTNTFTVTDASGNSASCSFTVTINDTEVPTITCPGNITQGNDAGTCGAVVTYTAPTGTDNCPGATTAQTAGEASGLTFPDGTTTNTFTVTDASGNSASCSFTVTVNDTEVPTITCPGNITQGNDAGTCGAVVTYTAPTGTDNCPGATTAQTAGQASGSTFPGGTTTNTFTVTDASGNSASCSFTVTVNDTEVPTITCPSNITQSSDAGTCGAVVSYTAPTGTDNCPGATTAQTAGQASGSAFPDGTTTNTFTVTDASGNSASCSFTVTVNDTEVPTITCPGNITQGNDAGTCGAVVSYTAPTGTDNCPGATTAQTAGQASGSTFPDGTTTNTFTVTDASGNSASCSFTVTVNDTEVPTITCPGNITQGNDAGTCGAVVTYTAPTGTDNCPGATTAQTAGQASGSAFPDGTTTNTFTVTDASGNSASCSFTVTVNDTEVPTITCPGNITQGNDAGTCGAVVSYTAPTGTDNCPGATTAQTAGQASGSTFPDGTTTNTFTVTDASGNSASCSFTVTVNDTEVPTITCPGNITQGNDAGTCGAVVTYTAPTGTDNCPGATTAQTAGQASGSAFPDGTTTNTFTVTDASGNSASCSFTVTVNDTEVPTISCPSNITQSNDAGTCGAVVNYTAPTGTDNCPGATTAQTAGQASGSTFPGGTTTNTFTVTDASGNSASCSFTVTVNDTEVPVITCPSNITQSNDAGTCGAVVSYTAPTGTDNCPGATTAQTAGQASGSTFPGGTTTNTFTVTDASGNSASCSFTVTVNDTEVPVITCPSNITQSNDASTCGAVVSYTAPTGTDNCPGATTAQTAGQASGLTFPDGTTTNTFTVTDASGNSASCSFTVTVNDTEVPSITCPGNITQGNDAGTCGAVVSYTAPTGTDNCPGATTAQTAGQASGLTFPDGTTTNTFTVTDASGNSASCSFTVTVNDTEVPTISCPSNITQSNDAGTCGAVVSYTAPTGTDNCPGATTAQTAGQASGSTFPGGTTTNTFTVTDASGNSASCSFTVTVNDTEVPTITCPSNITQSSDAGTCGAVVSYTAPTGTDNCPGATTAQTAGQASGSAFPDGTTTNTFTVTDASGNSASCSFTVTVNDTEVPTITCPGNITQGNDAGTCGAVVSYTAPTGTDNCPGATTAQTAGQASGSAFPDGTTTNTFTVTDASGNSASCSFTVTVNDTEVPTITCPGNITQGNDAGTCGAVVSYTAPTGTDNCPGATTAQAAGQASGSTFPDGTTTNTFTVTDASGNSASCSFTVTVNDTEVPTISCPADTTIIPASGCTATVASLGTPATSDNCGVASTSNDHPGTTYSGGTTIVTWTVTDNAGNTATCNQTVTVNAIAPTVTITPASTSVCPGGSVTLTAHGADTYVWDQTGTIVDSTLTFAPAGNVTVHVIGSMAGCSVSDTASSDVTIGSALNVAVNSPSICSGETATLTATGAATYTWTGGLPPDASVTTPPLTSTTTYTVTGTLNGCTNTAEATVTIKPSPNTQLTASENSICSGGSVTLTASGADTYTWQPSGSGTSQTVTPPNGTTTYTVTGTDNASGCSNSASQTIAVNSPPATPDITQSNDTLFSSVIVANGEYRWFKDGSLFATTSTPYLIFTQGGMYAVQVVNGDCESISSDAYLVIVTGVIKHVSSGIAYTIIPNPNNGNFEVRIQSSKDKHYSLILYNVTGQEILKTGLEVKAGFGIKNISLDNIAKGVYLLNISDNDEVVTQRIVVQ